MKVKILEVGLIEVKYKKYEDPYGITYGILKSEVKTIHYESGRIERFEEGNIVNDELLSPEEKCACGRSDAERFHGRKSTFFALGVVCAPYAMIGTAFIQPAPRGGKYTVQLSKHQTLFNDPDYLKCYRKKARADMLGAELSGFITLLVVEVGIIAYFNSPH